MNGTTDLTNATIHRDLSVNGTSNLTDATVHTDLSVNGTSNLTDATVHTDLSVNGMTNLSGATVHEDLSVNGTTKLSNATVNNRFIQTSTLQRYDSDTSTNLTIPESDIIQYNTLYADQSGSINISNIYIPDASFSNYPTRIELSLQGVHSTLNISNAKPSSIETFTISDSAFITLNTVRMGNDTDFVWVARGQSWT